MATRDVCFSLEFRIDKSVGLEGREEDVNDPEEDEEDRGQVFGELRSAQFGLSAHT